MRLGHAIIGQLPAGVIRPAYDPAAHGIGIVHLGIGAFHRAHQAVMTDDVLGRIGGDWRIMGISLRSGEVRDQLGPQDGLYSIAVRDGTAEQVRVVGAVAGVMVASECPADVIALLAARTTHIVTLTITEKGYCHDPATHGLRLDHPDIAHDIHNPDVPRSAIGFLVAGLAARMASASGPVTILSCDNLPDNGRVLADAVEAMATIAHPKLLPWLRDNVRFPATMVDRIVPATTQQDRAHVAVVLGHDDAGHVKTEPFSQWVIEDRFAGPRPAWEHAGAQIVKDVRPFELAKLRMLNGSHSTLAYLGLLSGYETVDRAMADPAIAAVIDRLMDEAAATLPTVPGLDPVRYAGDLKSRFANSALGHRLAQIAIDGSQKLPQRLLGTIADAHESGRTATAAAMGVAAWLRHFATPFVNDPLQEDLRAAAADDADALLASGLALRPVFGELAEQAWFRGLIREAIAEVDALTRVPA